MKTSFTIVFIVFQALIAINANAQNLVLNGSAEYYDTTTLVPTEWTIVSGNWTSRDHTGYTSSAHDSTHIFYEGNDAMGELQQDVNVNGYSSAIDASNQYFSFSGWVQSKSEVVPTDQTTITLQCLDATKLQVLYVWHSDTSSSISAWTQKTAHFNAPPGTRFVRIKLMAIRNQGTENDGYFDDIVLNPSTGTGVKNVAQSNIIKVTPNPVKDLMHISLDAPGIYSLNVTTMMGTTVVSRPLNKSTDIDLSSLPAGMYFIKAFSEDKTSFQDIKFIKE